MKWPIVSLLLVIEFIGSYAQEGLNKKLTPKLKIVGLDNTLVNNSLQGHVHSVTERCWYLKEKN